MDTSDEPLVSIVLPTHNGARYLRESVDSCLRQTHRNLELIIVNDGSTDETEEIVLSYQDPRIVYLRQEPNAGLPRSLNAGFARARGQYLTWTSDDNRYADEALEVMVAELQRRAPRVQLVYCDYQLMDEAGQMTGRGEGKPPGRLREENVVGACFLYTAAVGAAVGPYHAEVSLAEDYEYWLRVLYRFGMRRIARPLYFYRRQGESLSARYGAPYVREVAERARRSARAGLPWYQRWWESTARSPRVSVFWRRGVAAVEEGLRPRRRLRQWREPHPLPPPAAQTPQAGEGEQSPAGGGPAGPRIVYVKEYLMESGGAEQLFTQLAVAARRHGYDPVVVLRWPVGADNQYAQALREAGIAVYGAPATRFRLATAGWAAAGGGWERWRFRRFWSRSGGRWAGPGTGRGRGSARG